MRTHVRTKKTEVELPTPELPSAFARSGAGTWTWDIASDRLHADGVAAGLLGAEPEVARGGVPLSRFAAGIHPDDRATVLARMRSNAARDAPVVAEFRVVSADGTIRWLLARGRYDLDGRGRPVRGRGILVDLSGTRLEGPGFDGQGDAGHPLDRAAHHCLSARQALIEAGEPFLTSIVDMLLLELGRALAKLLTADRRHMS